MGSGFLLLFRAFSQCSYQTLNIQLPRASAPDQEHQRTKHMHRIQLSKRHLIWQASQLILQKFGHRLRPFGPWALKTGQRLRPMGLQISLISQAVVWPNNNPCHNEPPTWKILSRASATRGHSKGCRAASHLYRWSSQYSTSVISVWDQGQMNCNGQVKPTWYRCVHTHRPRRWFKLKSTWTHRQERERETGTVMIVLVIDGSVVGDGHHGNTW